MRHPFQSIALSTKYIAFIWILAMVMVHAVPIKAQQPPPRSFNLNASTGLPDNHIYTTTTDHLGYLWIATPKGVVRYNGYGYTVFDINKGLPTDDNWFLLEDKKGRMWLGNASHELGYIRNDRYYAVIRNSPDPLYITYLVRYRDGILAINKGAMQNGTWQIISYIKDVLQVTNTNIPLSSLLLLNEQGLLFGWKAAGKKFAFRQTDSGLIRLDTDHLLLNDTLSIIKRQQFLFRNYYCIYSKTYPLTAIRIDSPQVRQLRYPKEILYSYAQGNHLYLLSTDHIYVYDSLLRLKEQHTLAQLTNNEKQFDKTPFIYYNHTLWGPTLGTGDKGLYINGDGPPAFLPESQKLEGYHFIGNVNDTQGYWWNMAGQQLMQLSAHSAPVIKKVPDIQDVVHLFRYRPDSALISVDKDLYWLTSHTLKPAVYRKSVNDYHSFAAVMSGRDTIFILTSGSQYYLFRSTKHGYTKLTQTRCRKMVYDPFRKGLWLYRNQQLVFYDIGANTFRDLNHEKIRRMGLRKIEQVCIDETYGNIFIKDYDQLFRLDEAQEKVTALFPGVRCSDATLLVQNNRLLLAGRFGLLSCNITGKGLLEAAVVRENKKDQYYQSVYDLQLLGDKVILNTDKGAYSVMPEPALQRGIPEKAHRFIIRTNDSAWMVSSGDTLLLEAGAVSVLPDVINPGGTGRLEFSGYDHTRKKSWAGTAGTEISLAHLKAGVYHTFSLKARDQVWQSKELTLRFYLKPYWWQTSLFHYLLVLLSLAVTGIVVFTVSRIAVRRQLRRQHMLEMGLTGVHAQINPHFIFNSLTTTQYFIKANRVDDAYRHINRFSKLLRNFLQASRDQYITIREEVQHLQNYIELQQARFTEKFEYAITIAPVVDPESRIPSLLLQPLVENAIQHGLFNKKEKGHLRLSFIKEGRNLVILVDDDGIGREKAGQIRSALKNVSYGTDLIRKLIYIYGKYEKLKIDLSYTDKKPPETGTLLRITIIYPPV